MLPYPDMNFTPLDVLTAEELDQIVANIEALSDGSGLQDGVIVLQSPSLQFSEPVSSTAQIPVDDTIPQNTEGFQIMELEITPKYNNSVLEVEIIAFLSVNAASRWNTIALFKDSDVSALAAASDFEGASTAVKMVPLRYRMTSGTTSPITFKVRAGANNTGTTSFNGGGVTARLFGAIPKSSIKITEYKA